VSNSLVKQLRHDLYAIRGWIGWVHLLVDDTGISLVDSGFIGDKRRIQKAIRTLGYQSTDLKAILLTHGHLDHTLNAAALRTWTGAQLYAPAGDELHVEGRYPYCGAARVCGWLETAGRAVLRYQPPKVDIWTRNGGELPYWGGLRVLALPGHTAGHVGFYSPSKRVLFVGDAFAASFRIALPVGILNTDTAAVRQSFLKLAATEDITLIPAHYFGFDHHFAVRIQAKAKALRARLASTAATR
jgi:glyoxylase-like metal-dependent hydrolase (beta-lactamase superfamily II)